MRFIGVIPARMASSRFPGKPLALIDGRPMLFRVWDIVAASRLLWPSFVAAEDDEIIEACAREQIPCIVTRRGCRTGTERVIDAMRHPKYLKGDVVVNVQGDEPLLRTESLDALCRAMDEPGVAIASLYSMPVRASSLHDRNRVKVFIRNGWAQKFVREVSPPEVDREGIGEHIGVYAFARHYLQALADARPDTDLEQTAWLRKKHRIRMVESLSATDPVDCLSDIARVEAALHERRLTRPSG